MLSGCHVVGHGITCCCQAVMLLSGCHDVVRLSCCCQAVMLLVDGHIGVPLAELVSFLANFGNFHCGGANTIVPQIC